MQYLQRIAIFPPQVKLCNLAGPDIFKASSMFILWAHIKHCDVLDYEEEVLHVVCFSTQFQLHLIQWNGNFACSKDGSSRPLVLSLGLSDHSMVCKKYALLFLIFTQDAAQICQNLKYVVKNLGDPSKNAPVISIVVKKKNTDVHYLLLTGEEPTTETWHRDVVQQNFFCLTVEQHTPKMAANRPVYSNLSSFNLYDGLSLMCSKFLPQYASDLRYGDFGFLQDTLKEIIEVVTCNKIWQSFCRINIYRCFESNLDLYAQAC